MGSIKNLFESFKEFIWDIVGYVLPGAYYLILMSLTINGDYFLDLDYVFDKQYYPCVIVIISYLLGYAFCGLNILIQKIFGNKSYTKIIENNIKDRISYKTSVLILQKKFQEKDIAFDPNNASLRDLRNIAMGFFPEQDQKIYTFSFRAEIANHAGTISILFGILGILSFIINCITSFNVIIVDETHVVMYVLLVISYFFFSSMRDRFYAISLSLPFSLLSTSVINEK